MKKIASWTGMITLGNDRPFFKYLFDIKGNLIKAINEGFCLTYLMFLSFMLIEYKQERFFSLQNPFFNSLFAILIEVK